MLGCLVALAASGAEDVVVEVVAGHTSHVEVSGLVEAPVDLVLEALMDCEGFAGWFPDLLETRLVEQGDRGYRCAGVTDLPWPLADQSWELVVRQWRNPDGSAFVAFAYVPGSGDLDGLEGYWRVEPSDGRRSWVTYEAAVDLGSWIPDVLVSWATERMLPGILDGLEEHARSHLTADVAYRSDIVCETEMAK